MDRFQDDNSEIDQEIQVKFFDAVKNENIPEIIKYFKNENLKVWSFKEEEEYTALHRAAFMNLTQVLCTMIDEMRIRLGIEAKKEIKKWVNEKTEQGFTALHYCSYRGNIELINKLIENDAEIEATNRRGLNVLHMAAQGNQPNALVYFKEKYLMNIQSVDDLGSTPLHWACYTGSETAVMFLLSWPQNLNAQDREGLTPLHLAVMSERTRIIKKLLQKGSDKKIKDNKGRTAYDLAISKNKISIIEMLKEQQTCQICVFKVPLEKTKKNNLNIVLFFALHLIIEFVVFFILLPYINNPKLAISYLILFVIVIGTYLVLLFSNPGLIKRDINGNLMRLVDHKANLSEFCPECVVKKTPNSKHCIICEKCVDGFDHHCYWVNNCIGKKNFFIFLVFIILVAINLILNLTISIWDFTQNIKDPLIDKVFPPALPFKSIYTEPSRIVWSSVVLIIGIIFLVPVLFLLFIQIKNGLYRFKKESRLRSKLSIASKRKSMGAERNDKSALLLQNLKTDDENLFVKDQSKETAAC